jgi:hypothetical protein
MRLQQRSYLNRRAARRLVNTLLRRAAYDARQVHLFDAGLGWAPLARLVALRVRLATGRK